MLLISLEKSGQILGDLLCSVYPPPLPRISLRSGKILMTRFKTNKFRLLADDLNSTTADITNTVSMGGKV